MEFLECKISGTEPTLLFDEGGFRFFLGDNSWSFYPHLWMEFGDKIEAATRVTSTSQRFAVEERPKDHDMTNRDSSVLGVSAQTPDLQPGGVIFGIDRTLTHAERHFTFGMTLSDLISHFFTLAHEKMGGSFQKEVHLRIIRPSILSREPSLEGLAVVRLKGALMRAGFPEKQKWVTPFESIPESEGDLEFFTGAFSQIRSGQKDIACSRGYRDEGMIIFGADLGRVGFSKGSGGPSTAGTLTPLNPDRKKNQLIEEAKTSFEVRSQLPFLKDWAYLKRLYPSEVSFLQSPQSLGQISRNSTSDDGFNPDAHRHIPEAAYFIVERGKMFGAGKRPRRVRFT